MLEAEAKEGELFGRGQEEKLYQKVDEAIALDVLPMLETEAEEERRRRG
jgi:hypothetical protein